MLARFRFFSIGSLAGREALPIPAYAEAEAFFAKKGAAAVADGSGVARAMPVEGGGEGLGSIRSFGFEVVDGTRRHGEMGTFGSALGAFGIGGIGQGVAGDWNGFASDGSDKAGGDGFACYNFMAFSEVFPGAIKEHDLPAFVIDPTGEPADASRLRWGWDCSRAAQVPRAIETSRPILVSSRAGQYAYRRRRGQKRHPTISVELIFALIGDAPCARESTGFTCGLALAAIPV